MFRASTEQRRRFRHAPTVMTFLLLITSLVAGVVAARQTSAQTEDKLTGNWAVRTPNADGTFRVTYLNLKQEGSRITGYIRTTQFYYLITESTGGPESFTLTATMKDGASVRSVKYEGKLVGDELHISTRRNPTAQPTEMVAHRAPLGEGAFPARLAPPTLHQLPDNGLARTPPMGWNSWNKFAGRIDGAAVRSIADAMASNGMRDAGYTDVHID